MTAGSGSDRVTAGTDAYGGSFHLPAWEIEFEIAARTPSEVSRALSARLIGLDFFGRALAFRLEG